MSLAAILLCFCGAVGLGLFGTPRAGAVVNAALCCVVFLLTLAGFTAPGHGLLHADDMGLVFGALTGCTALTAALANIAYVRGAEARLRPALWRLYHALCQIVLGATLLGLYADNTGMLWLAMEIGSLAAALAVSLPRTAPALAAAWKYFILSAVGLGLALLGTLLVYLAAQPVLGPGLAAMSFAALSTHAAGMDGALLSLAFIFLLFGYGAKAALVPLHGWLPDAYAHGPAPLTTILSGAMVNLALIAILRFRHLLMLHLGTSGAGLNPEVFLLGLGLASLVLAGFALARRRGVRRFFGFATIGQSGLVLCAFGIGGPAIFGGLLQMAVQSLIRSGLFVALLGAAGQRGATAPGDYSVAQLRGTIHSSHYTALVLGSSMFALTGLPPSGLFVSEFIIIGQTAQRNPWICAPLALGLGLCAVAMLRAMAPLIFGPAPAQARPLRAGAEMHLAALNLLLAIGLAFAMPGPLLSLFTHMASAMQ